MAKRSRRSRERTPGFTPTSNPELASAMRELRRSSAASRHTPLPRKGSRQERKAQAIRDHREA
ncbi:hypothetical protein Bequi_09765 [Brachybacterium sp. JHP9]|uniref:Uncharacterized protein n=1 Tax=Brachybacterium equifaecis TaxID=2910770 RepID=A0ABT0R1P2_9MICO|nr:hypothetical protein [Brachybacterium equifaecis]MCL6423669.1 hypothetical protein [Brachybacterium equifaecis]